MRRFEVKVYVVSLKSSERRKVIEERASSIGVEVIFVDAVVGCELTSEIKSKIYDEDKCIERYARGLTDNEIACFLSHIKIWKLVQEGGVPAVILEDDAIFVDGFLDVIDEFCRADVNADIVLLGHSKLDPKNEWYHYFKNPIYKRKYFGTRVVGNVLKLHSSGMVGYWLTEGAAQKLISDNQIITCVSDDWWVHGQNGMNVKEVRPYIIREDFQRLSSALEGGRQKLAQAKSRYYLEPARIVLAVYRNIKAIVKSFGR